MSKENESKLLGRIFELFPGASFVVKARSHRFKSPRSKTKAASGLVKQAKRQRPVLRSRKHKYIDPRQLSLFGETT